MFTPTLLELYPGFIALAAAALAGAGLIAALFTLRSKIPIAQDYTLRADCGGTRSVICGIPTTGKQANECQVDVTDLQ